MQLVISASEGAISMKPALPKTWSGGILSGSEAHSYSGPSGTFTIQKLIDEKFSICYGVLHVLKKTRLFWTEEPLFRIQYVLEGKLRYKPKGEKPITLSPGQVNAVWAPERETAADLSKGTYEFFQMAVNPALVQELRPHFPKLQDSYSENSRRWIREDKLKDIYEILNLPYDSATLRFYYENKVREHLFAFLCPSPQQEFDNYPDDVIERVIAVDHAMLKDLGRKWTLKELVKMAKMPEAKLVKAFKEIVGTTMFARYKEAKLEKAKTLLITDNIPIKNLYSLVGYASLTGFIDAFKEKYGLPPNEYRDKYKLFD